MLYNGKVWYNRGVMYHNVLCKGGVMYRIWYVTGVRFAPFAAGFRGFHVPAAPDPPTSLSPGLDSMPTTRIDRPDCQWLALPTLTGPVAGRGSCLRLVTCPEDWAWPWEPMQTLIAGDPSCIHVPVAAWAASANTSQPESATESTQWLALATAEVDQAIEKIGPGPSQRISIIKVFNFRELRIWQSILRH